MRWALAGGFAAGGLALAGCAIIGGFDFAGYTPVPEGTARVDASTSDDGSDDRQGEAGDDATDSAEAAAAVDAGADGVDAISVEASLEAEPDYDTAALKWDSTTVATNDANAAPNDAAPNDAAPNDAAPNDAAPNDACTIGPLNCGGCGHGCQGGACVAGQCQPVVLASATLPAGLAVTDSDVLWIDGSDIKIAPASGGAASVFFASKSPLYGSIVVDSTNAYWSMDTFAQTGFLGGPGGTWYFDDVTSPIETLTALAVDNLPASSTWVTRTSNLYVVRHWITTQGGGCATEAIDIVPLMNSATVTPWTAGVCNVVRMVTDAGFLYWTDTGTGNSYTHPAIWRHALLGATSEPVAAAQAPFGIGVYGGSVYWTDANAGVMQYDLRAATGATQLAKATAARDMAVDSSGVYWIEGQYGKNVIRTVALSGGAPRTLATGQTAALAIATNANAVFWLTPGSQDHNFTNGAVMKVAK